MKFDIHIYDYFKYPEEFKVDLTDELYSHLEAAITEEPRRLGHYFSVITDQLQESELHEEFERADILKRLKIRFEEEWGVATLLT
jgi:hypothetical protein